MGLPSRFQKKLDDEELFNMYFRNPDVETGRLSFKKIHKYVVKEYGNNPDTGRPYTESAVYKAVMRYLARNYADPEIEAAFNMWPITFGLPPLTHEEYLHEISKRAKGSFTPPQYRSWCEKHDDIEYLE